MSAGVDVLRAAILSDDAEPRLEVRREAVAPPTARWSASEFEREQLRALVRRVFFPGWPRPAKQVVFAGIEDGEDMAGTCLQVAQTLAAEVSATVALVPATAEPGGEQSPLEWKNEVTGPQSSLQMISRRLSEHVYEVPAQVLAGQDGGACPAARLRDRIHQLRHDFEYCVLYSPPLGRSNQAALLGQLTDGVVLVLQAHQTRRAAASKAQEVLRDANAKLIGVVLKGRRFPIPEGLYRRL